MSKVLIISNGPSANELSMGAVRYDYDLVIGVNWTCLTWPCDWICAYDGTCLGAEDNDYTPPRLFTPKGVEPCEGKWMPPGVNGESHPKFFLHWHAIEWLRGNRPDIRELLSHEYVMTWPAKHPDVLYSGIAPLHLMHILGLNKADIAGYDMAGDIDHTGGTFPPRKESRWVRERELFNRLCQQWHLKLNKIT